MVVSACAIIPVWPAATKTLLITAVLITLVIGPVHAQSGRVAEASATESGAADLPILLDVTMNGVKAGVLPFIESQGRILIPALTARVLRIRSNANAVFDPATSALISYELDRPLGNISFVVPASQMTTLTLGSDLVSPAIELSPETTGVFMNYDVSVRKTSDNLGSTTGYGGFAMLQALGPDFVANSGWSFQRSGASSAPIRLDSFVTWRPAVRTLAVSLGDTTSAAGATARPFRFIGISAGTDHSAEPGWNSRPIASIAGTAQPASSIDLYVNGVKRDPIATTGGPFNLILPPGNYQDTTRVVVTDLTGAIVEIPLDPPRFNLDLVQADMLLWSAGLGRPRFSWGTRSNDYLASNYGYANVRYGISNQSTLLNHLEAGSGLTELEVEIKSSLTPRFGLSGSIAHSWTPTGQGDFVKAGTVVAMADTLFFTANYGRSFGEFHDAVSWSARAYDRKHGVTESLFDRPRHSSIDSQVSWQASGWLTLSSSYQRFEYQDSSTISFAALTAQANIGRGATAFLSASRSYDDDQGESIGISMGISISLGAKMNGSASVTRQDGKYMGQTQLSRPLGQERGSYGWQISESSSASDTYINSAASYRTGRGIPAFGYTHFAGQSQTSLSTAGAVGIVAGHAFTSDPVYGGIIIADVGQPNVPILLNGYETTRSGRDGLAAISVEVAGTPQHIEIDDSNLPLSAIAGNTLQLVTIRAGGGSVAHFGLNSSASGAIIIVRVNGRVPLAGTEVITTAGRVPVDQAGRAWIPSLDENAVLILELPDRRLCSVSTRFDGKGGPGRVIGPLDCSILI